MSKKELVDLVQSLAPLELLQVNFQKSHAFWSLYSKFTRVLTFRHFPPGQLSQRQPGQRCQKGQQGVCDNLHCAVNQINRGRARGARGVFALPSARTPKLPLLALLTRLCCTTRTRSSHCHTLTHAHVCAYTHTNTHTHTHTHTCIYIHVCVCMYAIYIYIYIYIYI
jgi:hypothetical protein